MVEFIVLLLATWRLSNIVRYEEIARPIRRRLGEGYNDVLMVETYTDTFTGRLIRCFRCVSVWCGLLCALVFLYDYRILLPLAASAVAIFIEKVDTQ